MIRYLRNMDNHIKIHNNDQIHSLLVGKQPRIGLGLPSKQDINSNKNDNTDFSKFPFPEPIEPLNHTQNLVDSNKLDKKHQSSSTLRQFSKLRSENDLINHVGEYLSVYETNYKRKTVMLHQELEEHFLQPVSRKLAKKVNGNEYNNYVKKRNRAISAFDKQTQTRDTFLQTLPEIPNLSFDTSDLTDPVLKFRKNAEKEKYLTKIIAQNNGEWVEPTQYPERDTMNLKKWKTLAQTRFYGGSDESIPKGKRVFDSKYRDSVSTELNFFSKKSEKQ